MRAEPEVAHDLGAQTSHAVGGNRRAHARSDLLGRQQTAGAAAALENERPQPRLRQVRRRDQAVVAGAHDDRVVSLPRHERPQTAFPSRSERRTWSAARRPDAPMIPPPGCVAAPHIQRFSSGVW